MANLVTGIVTGLTWVAGVTYVTYVVAGGIPAMLVGLAVALLLGRVGGWVRTRPDPRLPW